VDRGACIQHYGPRNAGDSYKLEGWPLNQRPATVKTGQGLGEYAQGEDFDGEPLRPLVHRCVQSGQDARARLARAQWIWSISARKHHARDGRKVESSYKWEVNSPLRIALSGSAIVRRPMTRLSLRCFRFRDEISRGDCFRLLLSHL